MNGIQSMRHALDFGQIDRGEGSKSLNFLNRAHCAYFVHSFNVSIQPCCSADYLQNLTQIDEIISNTTM